MRMLRIGRESAGFVRRGHPWVRRDRFTHGLDGLRAGELVQLADATGAPVALALADPHQAVCARAVPAGWSAEAAARRAWQRRGELHRDPDTDCYRVVHGEADGLPGLRVERYGPCLSAVVTADCILPWLDTALATLASLLPGALMLVHDHRTDARRGEVVTRRWPEGRAEAQTVIEGRELGLRLPLRPAAGIASGLYVDQRANRRWLRQRAAGARVLNLFAYTGVFSLSLLAAGAREAVDVDLSRPALARAVETATLNRCAGHRTETADARAFCTADQGTYDMVIVDPPTSAQGGGGWVARRDYPDLLQLAWRRVAPGGLLLATSNAQGRPFPLREALRSACPRGRALILPRLEGDLPHLPAFPEGLPFRAAAVERNG